MDEAVEQRRRLALVDVSRVLPGLYAWLATVLLPVTQSGASLAARAFALAAFGTLVLAFLLPRSSPRRARQLGVYGFLLGCFGAWLSLGSQLASDHLDPVRSALGALGFLLHALAWGAPDPSRELALTDNLVPGAPLQPRSRPSRVSALLLAVGIAVALLPSLAAFGVERPGSSLLAHAIAVGSGLLFIAASTEVALRLGKARQVAFWRERAARSSWTLAGLLLALGIGLLWLTLR